jgi:hypothetical protein
MQFDQACINNVYDSSSKMVEMISNRGGQVASQRAADLLESLQRPQLIIDEDNNIRINANDY